MYLVYIKSQNPISKNLFIIWSLLFVISYDRYIFFFPYYSTVINISGYNNRSVGLG